MRAYLVAFPDLRHEIVNYVDLAIGEITRTLGLAGLVPGVDALDLGIDRLRRDAQGDRRLADGLASRDLPQHVESGDGIAVELRITGTQTGDFVTARRRGRGPPAVPSNCARRTSSPVRDGRIASWRVHFDQLSFLGQLDLAPASA